MYPQIYNFKNPSRVGLTSQQLIKAPVYKFTHEYTPSAAIESSMPLLRSMFEDRKAEFKRMQGVEFDRYNPAHGTIMKPLMWGDERMKEALSILNLPLDQMEKLYLPWWIESAGNDFGFEHSGNRAHVVLGPRHSYETQMARQGVVLPHIQAVSVSGFVHTSDDQLVVALRAGANYPNTYYFVAGALGMLPAVRSGSMSIFDFFVQEELGREYGLRASDISEATLLCRTVCHGGDRDTSYVFAVRTPLSFPQVDERYRANLDEDKGEHSKLVGVPHAETGSFIRGFYAGLAKNDLGRTFERRVLLPQGAAPLLSYVGEDAALMDTLAACHSQPV